MKRLPLDQNISYRAVKMLSSVFHDCLHVSICGLLDSEDGDLWHFVKMNHCTILTFDADFYDMSLINGHPPKIIWLRIGNVSTNELVEYLLKRQEVLLAFLSEKEFGQISCLEMT